MLRCRGRGAPVLLQGRPRSLAPRVPARCRATHKDLPDPPKKGKDEKVEQDLKQGKVDPETLRRLAKSLTPEEAERLRAINDPTYNPKIPERQLPSEPKPLWRLVLEHIKETKEVKGPQPVGPTLDWHAARRPFDRPFSFLTLLSALALFLLWTFYTRNYEDDITKIVAELAANPTVERQHVLLSNLFYATLGFTQHLRRMGAPISESLEEAGITAAFVRAIAGTDPVATEWGYRALATFLSVSPEFVPPPRLGRVSKALFSAVLRDVVKESNTQRDIDLNMWRVFLTYAHQYEFARMVPTEVLVYIATRIATLADTLVLSPHDRAHLALLRKMVVPLSSNERADRFFKSQANDVFQREYEALKSEYPLPFAVNPVSMELPFFQESMYAILGGMIWTSLRASRLSLQANTAGLRPLWKLSRPHFSSLVNSTLWSTAGAFTFLFARSELTQWPDKTVRAVRAKVAGAPEEPEPKVARLSTLLAPHRSAIGLGAALLVANVPHAAGIMLGLTALDLWAVRHAMQPREEKTLRSEAAKQIEQVKESLKGWAIEKVYGSGPRY